MHADSFSQKGSTHLINEDYCKHGIINGYNYIIIADGCSSSKNTDVGARLLCLSFEHVFKKQSDAIFSNIELLDELIVDHILLLKRLLTLDDALFDATLLIAISDGNKTIVKTYGDGNIIVQKKNGIVEHHNIQYYDNSPFYLSYQLDESRLAGYLSINFDKGYNTLTVFQDNQQIKEHITKFDHSYQSVMYLNNNDFETVTLTTDGLDTFQDESLPISPLFDIIDFKNKNGSFVERRMKSFFRKNKQTYHQDDFTIATLSQ